MHNEVTVGKGTISRLSETCSPVLFDFFTGLTQAFDEGLVRSLTPIGCAALVPRAFRSQCISFARGAVRRSQITDSETFGCVIVRKKKLKMRIRCTRDIAHDAWVAQPFFFLLVCCMICV